MASAQSPLIKEQKLQSQIEQNVQEFQELGTQKYQLEDEEKINIEQSKDDEVIVVSDMMTDIDGFSNSGYNATPYKLLRKRRLQSQHYYDNNSIMKSKPSLANDNLLDMPINVMVHNPYEVLRTPPKKKKCTACSSCFVNKAFNLDSPEVQFNPYEVKRSGEDPLSTTNCYTNPALNLNPESRTTAAVQCSLFDRKALKAFDNMNREIGFDNADEYKRALRVSPMCETKPDKITDAMKAKLQLYGIVEDDEEDNEVKEEEYDEDDDDEENMDEDNQEKDDEPELTEEYLPQFRNLQRSTNPFLSNTGRSDTNDGKPMCEDNEENNAEIEDDVHDYEDPDVEKQEEEQSDVDEEEEEEQSGVEEAEEEEQYIDEEEEVEDEYDEDEEVENEYDEEEGEEVEEEYEEEEKEMEEEYDEEEENDGQNQHLKIGENNAMLKQRLSGPYVLYNKNLACGNGDKPVLHLEMAENLIPEEELNRQYVRFNLKEHPFLHTGINCDNEAKESTAAVKEEEKTQQDEQLTNAENNAKPNAALINKPYVCFMFNANPFLVSSINGDNQETVHQQDEQLIKTENNGMPEEAVQRRFMDFEFNRAKNIRNKYKYKENVGQGNEEKTENEDVEMKYEDEDKEVKQDKQLLQVENSVITLLSDSVNCDDATEQCSYSDDAEDLPTSSTFVRNYRKPDAPISTASSKAPLALNDKKAKLLKFKQRLSEYMAKVTNGNDGGKAAEQFDDDQASKRSQGGFMHTLRKSFRIKPVKEETTHAQQIEDAQMEEDSKENEIKNALNDSIIDTGERTMKLKTDLTETEYMKIEDLTNEKKAGFIRKVFNSNRKFTN